MYASGISIVAAMGSASFLAPLKRAATAITTGLKPAAVSIPLYPASTATVLKLEESTSIIFIIPAILLRLSLADATFRIDTFIILELLSTFSSISFFIALYGTITMLSSFSAK